MAARPMPSRPARLCATVALAMIVTACGGEDDGGGGDPAATGAAVEAAPTETTSEKQASGSVQRTDGQELLPELAEMPLPDGATLRHGYSSNGIASQQVDLDLGVEETAAFYRAQLPPAGFTIDDEGSMEGTSMIVLTITMPDGRSGSVTIQAGTAAATQVSFSVVPSP